MKILAASDLHGKHQTYSWLAQVVARRKPDAVVLAGDLLGFPDGFESVEEAQRQDAKRIASHLDELRVPVLFIMGNDDWVELEPRGEHVHPLHMQRMPCGSYNFVGYQFTLPFMGGVNERSEDDIAADLAVLESSLDSKTVLVTHSPAHGTLDSGVLGQSLGSISISETLSRCPVRAHIHGHIHECFGRVDHHFNVAAGEHRRAMLIDLVSLGHEVLQVSGNVLS